ncbi:MAG: D-alanine--D-alanine ligase family protein [Bacillota bacterium]
MLRKVRVGVIFGGRSGEHAVSLMSARSIMEAIDPERFEVVPIGITQEGRWLKTGDPWKALREGISEQNGVPVALLGETASPSVAAEATTRPDAAGRTDGPRVPAVVEPSLPTQAVSLTEQVDVVFPVLHGTYGEDGTIQGLLEMAGLPYVGAGVLGSALGMDKAMAKAVWERFGLPVSRYVVVTRSECERTPEAVAARVEGSFAYPVFVKPANAGSSVGVSKAKNREQLTAALDLACRYDRKVLVEEFINGREVECSVLGNDDPIASLPGEVVPCNEFYDYKAKYIDGDSALIIPAELPPDVTQKVRDTAVAAFKALDLAGMARVDFFVTRDGNRPILNEVNTIPGFTSISMYPKLWEATGLSYRELVTRLIELAIERYRDRQRSSTTYEV